MLYTWLLRNGNDNLWGVTLHSAWLVLACHLGCTSILRRYSGCWVGPLL